MIEDLHLSNYKHRKHNINDFIKAMTKLENAFADILNAEAKYLRESLNHLTPDEALKFNENLENILKLIIKKEIILEFLLDEIKQCPKECNEVCDCYCKDEDDPCLCKGCKPHDCCCHCCLCCKD